MYLLCCVDISSNRINVDSQWAVYTFRLCDGCSASSIRQGLRLATILPMIFLMYRYTLHLSYKAQCHTVAASYCQCHRLSLLVWPLTGRYFTQNNRRYDICCLHPARTSYLVPGSLAEVHKWLTLFFPFNMEKGKLLLRQVRTSLFAIISTSGSQAHLLLLHAAQFSISSMFQEIRHK